MFISLQNIVTRLEKERREIYTLLACYDGLTDRQRKKNKDYQDLITLEDAMRVGLQAAYRLRDRAGEKERDRDKNGARPGT